jgi:3-hydroxyacyl-[acyl-carrier-protein] dehydratase
MREMNNIQIRKYLPHRFPFLMVDRVESWESGKYIIAIKNVTVNEPHFCGHLPKLPVMPGVMMIEALAQASGILIYKTLQILPMDGEYFYLAGVDEARFKRMVVPGDTLKLHVEVLKERLNLWKFKGIASVDGEVACSAVFMNIKGPVMDVEE